MIPKIKNYLIIAGVLIILSLAVTNYLNTQRYLKEKAERIRQENNVAELLKKDKANIALNLTQSEYISSLSSENESLLKQLQIKPKTVVKFVEREVIIKDTIVKEVPVYKTAYNQWHISDKDKCWRWEADAYLWNDSLKIDRTLFDYRNKTSDVFYKKRVFKLWFIEIYSGKKIIQQTSSECGEVNTKTVQVIKR
jgi:sulfur carrier protein ThiS